MQQPDQRGGNPLQQALACVGGQAASNWHGLARHCTQQLEGRLARLSRGLQELPVHAHRHVMAQQQHHQQPLHGGWSPALAVGAPREIAQIECRCGCTPQASPITPPRSHALQAISLGGSQQCWGGSSIASGLQVGSSGAQPLGELAMAKDEVKARLAPIPVYTVANPKNEFVLVAGEVRRGRSGGRLEGQGGCARLHGMRCRWCMPMFSCTHQARAPTFGASRPTGQHTAGLLLPQEGGCRGNHRQGKGAWAARLARVWSGERREGGP